MSTRARHRRIIGVLPWIWRIGWTCGRWLIRHPQPLILLAVLWVCLAGLWTYASKADAFRVTHVITPPQSTLRVPSSVMDKNLWALDLRELAETLKAQQPALKKVRIIRQLPGTLRIEPIARVAVAQLRLDRWYRVDAEGFIMPEGHPEPDERLVKLSGLDRSGTALRVGKANTDARLQVGLRVLPLLRRIPLVPSRRLTELNVADAQQLRLVLNDEVEIRCGSEKELAAQLERLRAVLKTVARRSIDVRYIDVRFPEPVVGPRT